MQQHHYKLVKEHKDYKEAVIEKGGITAEFTLAEVDAMQERNRKRLLEVEGQLKVENAKMTNILRHHPDVEKMDGILLTAAALYKESQMMVKELEPKRVQIRQAIQENEAMIKDVMTQMKFDVKKTVKNRKG